MAKLKFTIHPLFFVFGLYFALTGKVFFFIMIVLSAVLHEFGHYVSSEKCGYKLDKICLMPYGAIIKGDMVSFDYKDEVVIAFFGPLTNFLVVLAFVSLWWFAPETYAYTEQIVFCNLSLATINLLPCYPLDGGRILLASLSVWIKRKTALLVCKIISTILGLFLLLLFVFSCFNAVNFSVLFFALFILLGAWQKSGASSYIRLYNAINDHSFKRGIKISRIVVSPETPIKSLIAKAKDGAFELVVVQNGKVVKTLDVCKSKNLLLSCNLYKTVGDYL